jgi:(2Fe-2S) ferredoxin
MAYNQYILICGGTGCESSKADDIYHNILDELDRAGAKNDVQVVKTGCFGFCEKGPIVKVLPDEAFYVEVKPEDAKELVAEHIVKGRAVDRLLYKDDQAKEHAKIDDISFYQKQFRVQKYVVCNADEGDPGAFMDRSDPEESDPHRVLEAWPSPPTPSAPNKGYIYVRAEYPLAVERLKTAIRKAKRAGASSGHHICETQFNFDMSRSASAPAPSSAARRRR